PDIPDPQRNGSIASRDVFDDYSVPKVGEPVALQIRFLIPLDGDITLECLLVSLVALDRLPIVEIHPQRSVGHTVPFQLYPNALDVPLSAIMRGEAKPHRSFQIIVIDIEVAAIDTELAEVRRVRIGKVMQRMDAAAFLGATLSELEVQVRVFGVFVSDHSDH